MFSSLADSANTVNMMLFPKTVGKTARTSPLSRLVTAVSCAGFKITVLPLELRKDQTTLYLSFASHLP